jgi:hypothetical protein
MIHVRRLGEQDNIQQQSRLRASFFVHANLSSVFCVPCVLIDSGPVCYGRKEQSKMKLKSLLCVLYDTRESSLVAIAETRLYKTFSITS